MQVFAFGTTWQCADYAKISNKSDQQCFANRTAQTCKFCVHHISRTALSQLKNILYSLLTLPNLALISFWATSTKQECHFT
ncbi:hypothetical protein O3M35_013167 [Rhynocoris fuscipes]|uniref:Uncharacterized protein n=1 Tax=Rhynocoris fuscipes TaxID=488301 RepID=A0AAW1CJD7_9HEMI